jgi:hypothetical protein
MATTAIHRNFPWTLSEHWIRIRWQRRNGGRIYIKLPVLWNHSYVQCRTWGAYILVVWYAAYIHAFSMMPVSTIFAFYGRLSVYCGFTPLNNNHSLTIQVLTCIMGSSWSWSYVWWFDLQLPMQSVPIITEVVNLNPAHGEVCSIQYYVTKFVSDLRQVDDFLRVLWFPSPI